MMIWAASWDGKTLEVWEFLLVAQSELEERGNQLLPVNSSSSPAASFPRRPVLFTSPSTADFKFLHQLTIYKAEIASWAEDPIITFVE